MRTVFLTASLLLRSSKSSLLVHMTSYLNCPHALRFISCYLPLYRAHPMFPEWNWRQYLFSQNLPHIQHVGVREASAQRGATTGASPGTTGMDPGSSFRSICPSATGKEAAESPALSTCEPAGTDAWSRAKRHGGEGCVCVSWRWSLCPPSHHSTGHHGAGRGLSLHTLSEAGHMSICLVEVRLWEWMTTGMVSNPPLPRKGRKRKGQETFSDPQS